MSRSASFVGTVDPPIMAGQFEFVFFALAAPLVF
jgi:hypothetical protein